MKKQFTILLMLVSVMFSYSILAEQAYADTNVSGNINVDTTWILIDSPYIVTDTVQVLEDVKLTIEPGVEVRFNENTGLNIGGELNAVGTESEMITFTSNQENPNPGDWIGLNFVDSSSDAQYDFDENYINGGIVKFAKIQFAGNPLPGSYDGAAINCKNTNPLISNCIISNNYNPSYGHGAGMIIHECDNIKILYNEITNNEVSGLGSQGGGMWIFSSSGEIRNNTISDNKVGKGGGFYIAYSSPIISYNTIKNNTATCKGGGIYARDIYTGSLVINYNNINNNREYDVYLDPVYTGTSVEIDAKNNYWGTVGISTINERIYDYYDDINLGKVNYEPYALSKLKFDGTDTFSQPPICTSWTYSDWSACQSNNTKSRTVISSSPDDCSGGNPILTQSCEYTLPTCTSWTYSDWSECINGKQTRTIIYSSPENCIDGNPVLSQSCQNETTSENDAEITTQPETNESNPEETSTTISDGDIIQCQNSSNPSAVYIVKIVGDIKYIRHIVSLDIFNYYKHLKWGNLKQVDFLDDYSLSGWVRYNTGANYTAAPTDKVYEINGDQTKHWINMTAEQFLSHGGSEPAIFNINQGELNLYIAGADVMSL